MTTNYERIKNFDFNQMKHFIKCCFCTSIDGYINCKNCYIQNLCEEMNKNNISTELTNEMLEKWLKESDA